ncbi:PKD domain-containing protein, partial [Candidatus Bathyarchaeota archaeon]|nr:PKD domain-containing protein [Candidatus Bathyarchaeota archaeon]
SMPYTDELGDGVDFNMCFYTDTIAPMPIPMDVESVTLVPAEELDSSGDVTLNVEVKLNAPPLPHQSYTIEIGIDVDMDPTTGASSPGCFYNGLGVDYDVGVEVSEGSVASVWLDRYEAGEWVTVAEPTADIVERTVIVGFPVDALGSPLNSGLTVYLITEGGLDMAPSYGDPPITFTFNYIPEPYFEAPETVNEGTSYELDASASYSKNGAVSLYEWDLDGDEVYEESHLDPVTSFQFMDDGVYPVGLRITDEAGFSSDYTKEITVLNTPPFNVEFSQTGELKTGEEVTFTGQAEDLGEDELTYIWAFGDGETTEGADVTHTYADEGDYTVTLTVTDDDGAEATEEKGVQVTPSGTGVSDEEEEPEPGIDPLLVILVVLFGFIGFLIYDYIKNQEKKQKKKKKKKEPGDFCEEHPEVVEEENKKCEEAMWALDDVLGPIEEDLDTARDQWHEDMRAVGLLIMEWDIAYAVIQSLTKSEKEIREMAEKVQKVAAIVKPGASMGKTAFKKGGEEAMKEMGKHIATEVGKGIAGEVSQTLKDLLSLEGWAMSEIGIGIAKLITGIDPKQEASDIRKKSMRTCTLLQSWVDHNLARTERYTHRTLHTCIDEAQNLIDRIDDALKDFEDAVAGFICVTCELTPEYIEHIQGMINELNDFIRAFGDLIDQVEQRLNQAVALYNRDDVYDSPYVRVNV